MGIRGDLAADLAEVMVHRGGIADRHDQRRRLALRRADRTKQIGRGEAEIFWRHRPAAGLPPHLITLPHLGSPGSRYKGANRGTIFTLARSVAFSANLLGGIGRSFVTGFSPSPG